MGRILRVPAIRSLARLKLRSVLGRPATRSGTGLQLVQLRDQPRRGPGSRILVVELVGVAPEAVQLPLATRILDVLGAAARPDAPVGGGLGYVDVVSRCFEQEGAPPDSSIPLEYGPQGSPVRVARRLRASQVRERGQIVGVEDQLAGLVPSRHTRSANQERHADILLVGTPLAEIQAVLAF